MTCGVAKFNHELASRLGIPCEAIGMQPRACPLVSVKPSEVTEDVRFGPDYDLFLHDFEPSARNVAWVVGAKALYAANELIALELEELRPDVRVAWCPSLVHRQRSAGQFRVVLFGMGHKRQVDKLKRLKKLLDATRYDYTVEVSTGIHEGSPWDRSWLETKDTLTALFGARLRLLGYLADDALVDVLSQSHLAALFYEGGVRANNTTLWAALEAGVPVITNLDAASPMELEHKRTVLDLYQTRSLTAQPLAQIAEKGKAVAQKYSWPRLLSVLVA